MIHPLLAGHGTIGNSLHVKKVKRGVLAVQTSATAKQFSADEKNGCSIHAMLNGGTCEESQ
jgi:hypothetical protein